MNRAEGCQSEELQPQTTPSPRSSGMRRWLPLAILATGLMVFLTIGGQKLLNLDTLSRHYDHLVALVAQHQTAAVIGFTALYAVATAFSFPGAVVLTLAGGCFFGTWLATLYVVIGATTGAAAVFLAARSAFAGLLRRRAGPALTRFEDGFRDHAFSYLLMLRLVPLFPFWLVNLVPAFLGVSLRIYTLATLIGIIPGAFVYASVGNGLATVFDHGGTPNLGVIFSPTVLLPLIGLGLLALIPVFYRKLAGPRATVPP